MTKKHDELVEEIAEKIIGYYDGSPLVAEEDRRISKEIITLILSAVRDGLPLLGEVGRFDWGKDNWNDFEHWVAEALHDDAGIFIIALRKKDK